jgi:hypothetical protein
MMPSLLIVYVQSLERAEAADKAAKLERCKLGGTNSQAKHAANAAAGHVTLFGGNRSLGGATDIKPQTRKDLATRAKFEDVGLNPATASKWQLAGKMCCGVPKSDIHKSNNSQSQPTTHGQRGCNDVHFDSIRDKKDFANAADARAGGWRIVTGHKSKTTDIQSWKLITK